MLPAGGAGAADETARLTIAAAGESRYAIVVPDDADPGRIAQAADLLRKTIAEAAGAELPVVKESALAPGTPAFYLGKSRAARRAGLPLDKVKGWAYLNQAVGNDVFLVGQDGEAGVKDRKDIEFLGALKAVIGFLEDQVGVRFFLPGAHGTYVPRAEQLTVDAAMEKFWAPRFDYVIGRAPRDRVLAVALNLFGRTPVLCTYGGHSYYKAIPAKKYGKTNPDYFALIGGVRTPRGNHLCVANAEVQELMLKEMEEKLDSGYEWVELAQTDGYQPCGCDACAAIHPDPGERTWIVHRELAEEMRKRRPGKKVTILSYPPTHHPPKSFSSFPDNVVVQLCGYTLNAFEAWAPYNVDKTVYVYNWGQYLTPGYAPKRTPRYAVEQVRMLLDNRVRGIYVCGGLAGGQGSFGLEGPSYYAYGKALGDPDRDPNDWLDEYVNAAFGEAAVPMRAFFTAMHDRLETFSVFHRPNGYAAEVPAPFRRPEDFYCHFFAAPVVAGLSRSLERAKAMAAGDRAKANVRLVEVEFGYVRNLAAVFQLYRAYRVDPSWTSLDLLGAKVAERKSLLEEFFPGGKKMKIDGLPSPFIGAPKAWVEAGGRNAALLGAPLNWDFALLRKNGVLPGAGTKKAEAPRVSGIVLDGRLDEPAWDRPRFEEMSEIGMGALKNATKFKVAYDGEGLCLVVVCDFDRIEPIEAVQPVGQDGGAWAQENIEIMVDPFGERERHCHVIINPVPESTYDARYGYIEDPLHPLYGKRDSSWNGKWQYATTVDREGKRWTAEVRIPFATLGVPPPGPGAIWTMNVGRTEYPKGYKGGPVYSLWSPNLETRSFHDRATFGDVAFK